jgi:hypothetical protein
MKATLVSVLREMGLFKRESVVSYDKPGYFKPLRVVRQSARQRYDL